MNQIKTIFTCGLVLASVGVTSMVVAAGAQKDGKAIVRSVKGDVTYSVNGGEFKKLRTNMELTKDTVLKSGAESEAFLQVNGFTSTVKLTADAKLTLEQMLQSGGFIGGDSTTQLKLDQGTVLGSVRKISANSEYKVAVPNGVASIRGTDFSVTVTLNANNTFTVNFRSVTGLVSCTVSAPQGGNTANTSQNLTAGQTWTVTGTINNQNQATTITVGIPTSTPPEVTRQIVAVLTQIGQFTTGANAPGGGGQGPTIVVVPTPSTGSDNGGDNTPPATSDTNQ